MDPFDPDDRPSTELEALLAHGVAATPDDALNRWLEGRIAPGRHLSIPTDAAYVLFRAWCEEEAGAPCLAPFAFARLMLTRFRKRPGRYNGGVRQLYLVSRASADRLRTAADARPATEADAALFSFANLRLARQPSIAGHPALRTHLEPHDQEE